MKANIVYNENISGCSEALLLLEKALNEKKIVFKSFELEDMSDFGDFTFVIGGDGTLLKAAKFYSRQQIPVLGVNSGRLGFLSQTGIDGIKGVIDNIMKGHYTIEDRLMLSALGFCALNDFVIKGCNPSRTSKFYLEINGKEVCGYIADGLIISTPTGSTAYGLSAGGPVLYPSLEAVTIVPICPHTLNARPLVVPAYEKLRVKSGESLLSVFVDGIDLTKCVDKIDIEISEKKAKLVFLKDLSFYSVLRDKLHWGISPEGVKS